MVAGKARGLLRGAACAACAIALAVTAAPVAAHAAGYAAATVPAASQKVVVSYIKGDAANKRVYRTTGKVEAVASSDARVVSAKGDSHGFDLKVRKPGKARVTYRLDGAERALSFTVRKYANPVKSFKLGGKEYAGKFKKSRSCKTPKEIGSIGKVKVRAAKGWRLKRIYTGPSENISITVKNGSRIGGALNVRAVLVHKASGLVETVEVRNGR